MLNSPVLSKKEIMGKHRFQACPLGLNNNYHHPEENWENLSRLYS
jgi:hypothetical protein